MTVTVRNLTRDPVVLALPPEHFGWQRHRVVTQVRPGKSPRGHGAGKPGILAQDRRFPHSITLMAKGTEGSEVNGQPDALKTAPDFVDAVKRRVIAIVDDEPVETKTEDPKAVIEKPETKKAKAEAAAFAAGSTDR